MTSEPGRDATPSQGKNHEQCDRYSGARHRRFQRRAGDRDFREAGRQGQPGGFPDRAGIRQGDDGRARAARRNRQGRQGRSGRQGERGQRHPRTGRGGRRGFAVLAALAQRRGAARADERAARRGRGAHSRHRRFQGCAGHRNLRESRRPREGRGSARRARIRQGDDGSAVAAFGRRARTESEDRRQGQRGRDHPGPRDGRRAGAGGKASRVRSRNARCRRRRPPPNRRPAQSTKRPSRSPMPVPAVRKLARQKGRRSRQGDGNGPQWPHPARGRRGLGEGRRVEAAGGGHRACSRKRRRRPGAAALAQGGFRQIRPRRAQGARPHQEDFGGQSASQLGRHPARHDP